MNKKTEVDFLNSKSGNVEKFSYREENKQEQKIDQYNPQGIDRQTVGNKLSDHRLN